MIKGKPITEYTHRGLTYVEGREDSEYELELKNNHPTRVEVIVSVDGLSIIDGKSAGPASVGYVLNAYQTAKIPGWMVDQGTAAKFKFGAKSGSYSTSVNGGSSVNNGVIGMIVYSEKVKPVYPVYPFPYYQTTTTGLCGSSTAPRLRSVSSSVDKTTVITRKMASNQSDVFDSQMDQTVAFAASAIYSNSVIEQQSVQNIGTEFGEATKFDTTNTTFDRGDMLGMIVIYYDNARGLRARGIEITRKKVLVQTTPDAFPAMAKGCVPPAGWSK